MSNMLDVILGTSRTDNIKSKNELLIELRRIADALEKLANIKGN